jgi:FAD:protein FMN transferase
MGTACRIHVVGEAEALATRAAHAAIAEVRRIETKYSRYLPGSIVSCINAAAGTTQAIAVDDETANLLDFAAQVHEASGGLFDITTGVLRQVWDFGASRLPAPAQLTAALGRIGWARVEWRRPAVRLGLPGMEIDFGGFGKEYAADRAATVLADAGVRAALVNLGGDMRALGPRPDGNAWTLGIAHPREAHAVVASIELHQGALATSGDYERYFELDGQRYCHILDPRSGWPAQHWRSVSVVASTCVAAGALTTIAMLNGADALDFLRGQGVDFLAVDANGRLFREGA